MSTFSPLLNMSRLKFVGNNKVFNSSIFNCNCNYLSCSCSTVCVSFPLYFNSRYLTNKNFNDYGLLSGSIFVLKEQCEKEILYLEDKKYEIVEKLRRKYFIKALMAHAVYSATQYGIANKLRFRILEFKKLIIFTESFINNSLVAEVNEINPKFIIFFYYLTKFVSLNLVKDKSYFFWKNVLRNLFFLFVFGFERLKFFNFINKTTLFFNLPTSTRRKRRKSDKVSASFFVYYGVVPLLFYSPFKASFFVNNSSRFRNFLVGRSRFVMNYSLMKFMARKILLKNRTFLSSVLRKLRLIFNLVKLKSNFNLIGVSRIKPLRVVSRPKVCVFRNSSFMGGRFFFFLKRLRFIPPHSTIRNSFKKQFDRYFFSLIRTFYLDRKFLLKRKRKKHNFKMKSRILFIIRSIFKSEKFFFVGNYLKLLFYHHFIRKLEGIFFHGHIFKFKIFENLQKYNVLFKIFRKITKPKLIRLLSNKNVSKFKKDSFMRMALSANSANPTMLFSVSPQVGKQTKTFLANFVSNFEHVSYKMKTFSKLKCIRLFFNIFLSIPGRVLNLKLLRFCFLLFFLRTVMKGRVFFSLNSFLFSKYVRFLFFRLNLGNFNKQSVGIKGILNQFVLVNFFFLNNFFYLFRRKLLINFFEKAKRSHNSFFGYFNLLFSLFNAKLISNATQSFIMKKKFYSSRFIKQFSILFHSFFSKSEFSMSFLNIKSDGKFVGESASKYFYSFLLPKGRTKKYRLIFLARLEAAKKRVLNLLSRFKKQKRKAKIIFHTSIRIQRKNIYRSLKRKANFFFRLLKIFMPSLKLAGRFSAFSVYRKKSKKLPILLDYYKKSFYIPKSFLRKCLDQNNNLFTRLTNVYLSKGSKLTVLWPALSVVGNIFNSFSTVPVSHIFFMKWKTFAVGNLFRLPVAALISEDSFKCVFTWLIIVKSKYILPLLSHIPSSFLVVFGSSFFDYFILTRFFLLFKLDSLFTKLNLGFVSVLLEASLVSEFFSYNKSVFLFLFCLPLSNLSESRLKFTVTPIKLVHKISYISKRGFSSSFLSRGLLVNKKSRSVLKIGKKICYFTSRFFVSSNSKRQESLQAQLTLRDRVCFFSFLDYYVFYKFFSKLPFESKVNSFEKPLEFSLALNYFPNWFSYFFLRKSTLVRTTGSFFGFNNNFMDYFTPFSVGFFSFLVFFFRKYRLFIYRVQKRKPRSRGKRCNKWFTFLRIFYFKYFAKLSLKKLKGLRQQSRTRVVLGFSANSFNKFLLFNFFFDFIQDRFKELVNICYSLFNSLNSSVSALSNDRFREYFNSFVLKQVFFVFLRSVTVKFRFLFSSECKNQIVTQLYRNLFGKHVKFYFLLLVKAVLFRDFDYSSYLFRYKKISEKFYSKSIFVAFRNMRYRLSSRNFIYSLFRSVKNLFPSSVSNKGANYRNFNLLFSKQSMWANSFFPNKSKFVNFRSLESKAIFPIFSLSQSSQSGQLLLKFLSNVLYLKLLKFLSGVFREYIYLDKLRCSDGSDIFFSSYFYLVSVDFYILVIYSIMFKNKLRILKKSIIGIILNRVGMLFVCFSFYNLRKIVSNVTINSSFFPLVKDLSVYLLLYLKKSILVFSTMLVRHFLLSSKKFKIHSVLPAYFFKYFLLKYFLSKGRLRLFLQFRRMFFRNSLFQKFYFEKFKFFRVMKLKVRRYTFSVVKKKARLFDLYLRKRKIVLGRVMLSRKHLMQKKSFFLDVFFSIKFLKFSGFKNFMACCSFFSSFIGMPYKLKKKFIKTYLFFLGLRISFLKSFFLKFFLTGLYLRYRFQMLNRFLFFRIIFLKSFKLYPRFYFVISRSRNNIFLTIRSLHGRLIYKCTPGLLKFKGSDKLSNFALYETCLYFFDIFIKLCQEVTLRRKFGYFFYNMRTRRKKSEEKIRKKRLGDFSRADKDLFQDPLLRVQRFFLITKGINPYVIRIFLKAMRRRKVSKYMAGTLEYPFIAFTNSKVRKVRRV